VLVLLNGFFVTAEFAIVKVRATWLEEQIRDGNHSAKLTKHIVTHLGAYLSATQLGITLASLGLGWIGEPLLAATFRPMFVDMGLVNESLVHTLSFLLGFGVLTFLLITLGELAPKAMAINHPESTATTISVPLQIFFKLFQPIIWILNTSSTFILKAMGLELAKSDQRVHSAEELEIMVSEGAKSGVLNTTEQKLLENIFEFSDTTVREVMVPRTEIVGLNITTSRDKLVQIVTEEGYSRLPVYKDSLDNIVGVIYTKDLLTLFEHRDLIVLQDVLRPAYFVPESAKISKLMRDLQNQKLHMAIVIDEFGGTQGLVTMEDILEEIVGEIHDEYDEIVKEVEQSPDGSALVDARIDIKVFNDKFGSSVPEDPEYETLNGFLYKITGKIPEIKEEIHYENLLFTVLKKSQRRIRQVKVTKIAPPVAEAAAAGTAAD
jgi:CBS domain containing-hemolysin-like protein